MSSFSIYWLIKLDAISDVLFSLGVLGIIAFVLLGIVWMQGHDTTDDRGRIIGDEVKKRRESRMQVGLKGILITAPVSVFLFMLSAMVPSTKEMCAIIVVPKIINAASENEALKNMPNVILETANAWIRDLTPSNVSGGVKDIIKELKK
jgi:hypothetical protein